MNDQNQVIIDSAMSFAEAIEGTTAPMEVIDSLSMIDVLYYSFDGQRHQGQILVDGRLERPIAQPILLGIALAAVFVAGAYVTLRIPALAAQVRDVLGFAQSGSLTLLTVTTLLSGIAEELFFRGGLYAAIPRPHQLWTSTVLYIAATVLTGNVMLAFAAAVLGLVTGLQRRATGGVLAPILTHITWSLSMLYVLPHVL